MKEMTIEICFILASVTILYLKNGGSPIILLMLTSNGKIIGRFFFKFLGFLRIFELVRISYGITYLHIKIESEDGKQDMNHDNIYDMRDLKICYVCRLYEATGKHIHKV